jgi:hypothetical protein
MTLPLIAVSAQGPKRSIRALYFRLLDTALLPPLSY